MGNVNNMTNKTNYIGKKVGKGIALVMSLLVLIFALLLLLAPMKASDMFYSLGMENLSVTMAHSAAKNSDSFDDWWVLFERALEAESNQMVCVATDSMQKHSDYSAAIKDKKVMANNVEQDGKYYVLYQQARCSLLESPEKSEEIWNWCVIKYKQNGWGSYVSTDLYMLNAIKGYVDALAQDDEIPLGDFFEKAENLWNKKDEFSEIYSSQRNDFAKHVKKLIEARQSEISQEIQDLWKDR